MNNETYLPLGSIVRLKGGKRKLIIIGVNQIGSDNKSYDYSSCMYPFGYLNSEQLFLFNRDKIEEIIFTGYMDDELKEYYEDLIWDANRMKEENKNGQ